ncbi:MAG: L-seryl-tRNA(Sec) selenium transferase [Deltaproteobacteria bacterium]|nr:L-seryl-tRNA(Sec) selenium transferase [Deltaproteobacteria bacterium]MBW2121214.1 L-seryl-tRNA(Sec) selenium transferase [Deltaproteobacteria bacterium]
MEDRRALLSRIPKVDEILADPRVSGWVAEYSRGVVVQAVRFALESVRQRILTSPEPGWIGGARFSVEELMPYLREAMERQVARRLSRVVNATGVVIHTNLGRSLLCSDAVAHLEEVSRCFSNLEYDLEKGERGSRYVHVDELLCNLTGAEASLVVNNNAAAVLLVLNTLAEGKEVIVSRGQLVEIGGAFRIPDVMRRSGARLVEVGTTNRTHIEDYHRAIGQETALLLKVHTSNFRIVGFTSEVAGRDLVDLGRERGIPVMEDLGSGCFVDLARYGLGAEPMVQDSLETGIDVVTFSGDKLLGGPQAGIILGRKEVIRRVRANPLNRALRIDKLTLAALESTLRLYLDRERALAEIPTLAMLTVSPKELNRKARSLQRKIRSRLGGAVETAVRNETSQVGGGACPLEELPTRVVSVRSETFSSSQLEERLRRHRPPVIARIRRDELLLDLRTIREEEFPVLVDALVEAVGQGG